MKKKPNNKIKDFFRHININYVPEQGAMGPSPERGIKRFWFLVRTHYIKLMVLSVEFILCSLPLLTIPASVSGLCHVCVQLERKGYTLSVFREFFSGFRDRFLDRMLLGAACLSLPSALAMLLMYLKVQQWIAVGVALAVFLLLSCVWEYFLILQDVMNLKMSQNIRNAFILMLTGGKTTAVIFACESVMLAILYFLYPYWILVFCFFGFAFKQLFLANLIWPVIKEKLVIPDSSEENPTEGVSDDG